MIGSLDNALVRVNRVLIETFARSSPRRSAGRRLRPRLSRQRTIGYQPNDALTSPSFIFDLSKRVRPRKTKKKTDMVSRLHFDVHRAFHGGVFLFLFFFFLLLQRKNFFFYRDFYRVFLFSAVSIHQPAAHLHLISRCFDLLLFSRPRPLLRPPVPPTSPWAVHPPPSIDRFLFVFFSYIFPWSFGR